MFARTSFRFARTFDIAPTAALTKTCATSTAIRVQNFPLSVVRVFSAMATQGERVEDVLTMDAFAMRQFEVDEKTKVAKIEFDPQEFEKRVQQVL